MIITNSMPLTATRLANTSRDMYRKIINRSARYHVIFNLVQVEREAKYYEIVYSAKC